MTVIVPDTPKPPRIAVIAYDGVQMSSVLGLGDVLEVANRCAEGVGGPRMEYEVLRPPLPLGDASFDAIVLPPNLSGARGAEDTATHDWIVGRHAAGALVCSACAGAFWLGHAGLLDGRPATTHWALEEEFCAAFPRVRLHPEHLLVDDHDIITVGGVMAWVDLGLSLVRRWHGPDVVARTCRQMLIDPQGREQRNYRSFRPRLDHGDDAIRALQFWMEENAATDIALPDLAARAAISERSLQRRFAAATGLPISRYIQEVRVEKARGLLERTSMPVSEVCWAVGYADASAFSRLFKSVCGVSAGEYRRRFSVR